MTASVRLLFFTQTFDCDSCPQAHQISTTSAAVREDHPSWKLTCRSTGTRGAYGIDRAPAVVLSCTGRKRSGVWFEDRFLGAPSGYEFVSLVQAILLVGGHGSNLTDANRGRIAVVAKPVTMRVFSTPTCPHCPRAVTLANEMAFANPNITAFAVEATSFPDLAQQYRVTGVPKTVVSAGKKTTSKFWAGCRRTSSSATRSPIFWSPPAQRVCRWPSGRPSGLSDTAVL